jgi:hypothetical protein
VVLIFVLYFFSRLPRREFFFHIAYWTRIGGTLDELVAVYMCCCPHIPIARTAKRRANAATWKRLVL